MIKRLSYLLLSSFLALGLLFGVDAHATSTVSFEGGAENFVFSPSNDLFGGFKDLAPGDTRTETITVKNLATDYDFVKLYLRAESDTATNGLLSQLTFNLSRGEELISSDASANLALGTFYPGDETTLTLEVSAPLTLGNAYQHTQNEIKWIFTAEAYKDGQIAPPNTGTALATPSAANETIVIASASALVLAMLTTLMLLVRKKQLSVRGLVQFRSHPNKNNNIH
ncbi:hypothetical protein IJG98_02295 [Candidatus Saccharibacteria bacterium]|nr:hypothetical protein [Candidatus Saccharibacteria bacterium]